MIWNFLSLSIIMGLVVKPVQLSPLMSDHLITVSLLDASPHL